MTILDKIIADKRLEVAARKELLPLKDVTASPLFDRQCVSLKERLKVSTSGIISEFKRKSPSKGWIHEHADVVEIASGYDTAGACGISILTDSPYFGGVSSDLTSARPHVQCAILRKDFIIDEYQLYEAKAIGADVILLIAAALTPAENLRLAKQAKVLGLEVLLEVHNHPEIEYVNDFIDMVGVNNRNLKTFEVNTALSFELSNHIPSQFLRISESGITDVKIVKELQKAGYQGFLMGENFMKEADPAKALQQFIADLT